MKSIQLATQFDQYQFITAIAPVLRGKEASYLTPEEVGEIAKMIEEASGSKKQPYKLRVCNPDDLENEQLIAMEPLESAAIFKYRTAARRYMVMTEIEKRHQQLIY